MLKVKSKLKQISALVKKLSPYPKKVQILAFTRKRSAEEIQEALDIGVNVLGEESLKEAEEKFQAYPKPRSFELHLVGPLPSNKVRRAVEIFDCIQSVDNFKLADKINYVAREHGKPMPIFIQINLTNDPSRPGFTPELLKINLPQILKLSHLKIRGFMIVAPKEAEEKEVLNYFKTCKKLNSEYGFTEISAGMSNDFPLALKEGSHCIRVGSALFGPRE